MNYLSSIITCCGLFGKKSPDIISNNEAIKTGCTNQSQQAIFDSATTTLNDSNFGVISPDNSLLQVKLETPNTPQTPQSVQIEHETNNCLEDEPIQADITATVDPPKKKRKRKILRRILTLSTSKKRRKLVNVSSLEN